MARVITPALLGAVNQGLQDQLPVRLRGRHRALSSSLCTIVPSGSSEETYGWLGDIEITQWIGDRQIHGLQAHGYSIKNAGRVRTDRVGREG